MKTKILSLALMSLLFVASMPAFAQTENETANKALENLRKSRELDKAPARGKSLSKEELAERHKARARLKEERQQIRKQMKEQYGK